MKTIIFMIIVMMTTGIANTKNQTINIAGETIKGVVKIKNIRNNIVYSQDIYIIEDSGMTPQSGNTLTRYAFANGNKFNSKSDIMIKFKNPNSVNIGDIESRYNLRVKRKMNSGDYLFENIGGDIVNVMNSLLENDSSIIERVSPNMILNMKPV